MADEKTSQKKVEVKSGNVVVTLPDHLKPPAKAGKMTPEELKQLPTARTGIGVVCQDAIAAIGRTRDTFQPPRSATPETLATVGQRAEGFDQVIVGIDAVRSVVQQANRIADADAHTLLSRLYDQVKTQAKDDPRLEIEFSSLYAYFAPAKARKAAAKP